MLPLIGERLERQSGCGVRCELGAMRTGRTVEDSWDMLALCCCHNEAEVVRALVVWMRRPL